MVKIVRVFILSLFCWTLTAVLALFLFKPPSALVGGGSRPRSIDVNVPMLRADAGDYLALKDAGIWESPPVTKGGNDAAANPVAEIGPPCPVFWRHIATVVARPRSYIVLRSDSGEIRTATEGGILPDGNKLITIAQGKLVVRGIHKSRPSVIKTYLN